MMTLIAAAAVAAAQPNARADAAGPGDADEPRAARSHEGKVLL